jgi:hypothetical protein
MRFRVPKPSILGGQNASLTLFICILPRFLKEKLLVRPF